MIGEGVNTGGPKFKIRSNNSVLGGYFASHGRHYVILMIKTKFGDDDYTVLYANFSAERWELV